MNAVNTGHAAATANAGQAPPPVAAPQSIHVALVSHTNAGKTTLARTWLRRDVGEVADRAHVTEYAESHVVLQSPAGDSLVLWDTPGFGDSLRLLKRLRGRGNPLGWFLSAVWDRFTDRPFFGAQQALKAARDAADVVLYVVNAAEDPAAAAYVEPELEILDWLDKPVCVVLNQIGEAGVADAEADVRRWRERLATRAGGAPAAAAEAGAGTDGRDHAPAPPRRIVDVLPLDAFTRCWLHEHVLLARLAPQLRAAKRAPYARLVEAWRTRQLQTFRASMDVLAGQLARVARDRETLPDPGLKARARGWIERLRGGEDARSPAELAARDALARRLDAAVREATDALVRLHGLDGRATAEILESIGRELAVTRSVDPKSAGVLGGVLSGALGGLAADVAAGGLTFGAGALIGGLVGAFGAHGAAQAWNLAQGGELDEVRWSPEFLDERFAAAIVRYLAVAHFGRGRGEFRAVPVPPAWRTATAAAVERRRAALHALWAEAQGEGAAAVPPDVASPAAPPATDALEARLARELREACTATLVALYPRASEVLESAHEGGEA